MLKKMHAALKVHVFFFKWPNIYQLIQIGKLLCLFALG